MIPVDLNRLREARKTWAWGIPGHQLTELVEAVMDAPQVWWCAGMKAGYYLSCAEPHLPGCGWVALVPVKEES